MRYKALVIASYPAPYRVAVFKELAKSYDLDIFFDTNKNEDRNADWFCKNDDFSFNILDNSDATAKFKHALKRIKQYDFVLAYDPARKPAMRAIVRAQLMRVPYFVNNDGAVIRKGNPFKSLIKRVLFHKAKLCFASGQSSAEYYKAFGADPDTIRFHNFTSLTDADILDAPVSESEKLTLRKGLGLQENTVYAITVGQFIERKGFDLLLEAWKNLKTDVPAHLMIVGGGGKRAEYEAFIAQNALDNITIIDFLPKAQLFEYYKASDLFVLPTREDIWGLVINESMACGLPVISSDACVAAKELVEDGKNGFLYPVNDTNELTVYLQTIINDNALRETLSRNNIRKMQGNTMENIGKTHRKDIDAFFESNSTSRDTKRT